MTDFIIGLIVGIYGYVILQTLFDHFMYRRESKKFRETLKELTNINKHFYKQEKNHD